MTSRTAWVAGNGVGLTWTAAFNSLDFTAGQPTNGQSLLSTVTIANGTALDQFMDFSIRQSISSSTIAAGANFALWICPLLADGSTYFAPLTAGTAAGLTPPWSPCAVIPIYAAATQTTLVGLAQSIIIPPGSFRIIGQNNCGFTLTATTQEWDYRTYNINLNS
jgi:hypothetical protein